jgi:ribosome biogenesis GTPase A
VNARNEEAKIGLSVEVKTLRSNSDLALNTRETIKHWKFLQSPHNALSKFSFIGFPNVGKSSIINSLKQEWICNVGVSMGLTR